MANVVERISHEQARSAAIRLINSHFNNPNQARCSIPAERSDDDILLMDYIGQQMSAAAMTQPVAVSPTAEELVRQILKLENMAYSKVPAYKSEDEQDGRMSHYAHIAQAALDAKLLEGVRLGLEAAAVKSDEMAKNTIRDERSRFTLADMQAMMRATARGISSDIRALKPENIVKGV